MYSLFDRLRRKKPRTLREAIIIVAPPWGVSGSGNLFAAQVAAFATMGVEVLLHLGPTHRWHRSDMRSFWRKTTKAMSYPGISAVTYSKLNDRMSKMNNEKLLSEIKIMSTNAGSAELPKSLHKFVREHTVKGIHANHAFEMILAERIANVVFRTSGRRPMLVCESHDVQTKAIQINYETASPGSNKNTGDEEELYKKSDLLLHCAADDLDFFTKRIPEISQRLHLPTIDARNETNLVNNRSIRTDQCFDFLFVGDSHAANLNGIFWLLTEVTPLLSHAYKFAFVGRIRELVEQKHPALYQEHIEKFLGVVDDIGELYTRSKAVLIPSFGGTGTSIKLIEAMCANKIIIGTTNAIRGLPADTKLPEAVLCSDNPRDFAGFMQRIFENPPIRVDSGAFYDMYFSNKHYIAQMRAIYASLIE